MIGLIINDINITDEEIDIELADAIESAKEDEGDYVPDRKHVILNMVSNIIGMQCNQREDISGIQILKDIT